MRCLSVALLFCAVVTAADGPFEQIERQFRNLDKDNDGKVTEKELSANKIIEQMMKGADKDGDKVLTLDEVRLHFAGIFLGKDPRPGSKLEPVRIGPMIVKPGAHGVGRQAPDIAFKDTSGKSGKLSDFKDKKALVVAFTSTSCPIAKKYAPALGRLEKKYREQGVGFIYVNPFATDDSGDIRAAIKTNDLTGPYVHDAEGSLAAAIGAEVTTDVFVLDPTRTIIYRGALNDQYGQGYAHNEAKNEFVALALEALLAGKEPAIAATVAPGCALEFKKSSTAVTLTYHRDVARLVQTNCVACHRKDGIAPFTLETYKDVVAHAGEIRRVIERGVMPPWFAAPAKDGHSPWSNDASLSQRDKDDLLAWLKSDRPEGNQADGPRPRAFPAGWQIGTPDLIVKPEAPVKVKAEGTMEYVNVFMKTAEKEDKWVQAYEIRPSARQVVHHVLVFVIPPVGSRDPYGPLIPNDGLSYWAIYVPGNSATIYPPDFAKRLPKGSRIQFQVHYTPNGTATEDTMELGMVFAKAKPKHELRVMPILNTGFAIPPGNDNYKVEASSPLPFNVKIIGFLPHMHLRGKAFRYEVEEPGKQRELLLDVPRYDFNWQLLYKYAEPRGVPRGSRFIATGWFDNSAQNPANPDPRKTVRWGLQTFEEMMLGYVEYYVP